MCSFTNITTVHNSNTDVGGLENTILPKKLMFFKAQKPNIAILPCYETGLNFSNQNLTMIPMQEYGVNLQIIHRSAKHSVKRQKYVNILPIDLTPTDVGFFTRA